MKQKKLVEFLWISTEHKFHLHSIFYKTFYKVTAYTTKKFQVSHEFFQSQKIETNTFYEMINKI